MESVIVLSKEVAPPNLVAGALKTRGVRIRGCQKNKERLGESN